MPEDDVLPCPSPWLGTPWCCNRNGGKSLRRADAFFCLFHEAVVGGSSGCGHPSLLVREGCMMWNDAVIAALGVSGFGGHDVFEEACDVKSQQFYK